MYVMLKESVRLRERVRLMGCPPYRGFTMHVFHSINRHRLLRN